MKELTGRPLKGGHLVVGTPSSKLSLSLSNLFLVEKRDQRLANLFGNNNNAHNQSCEVKSTLFCKVPYFYTILYLTS